MTDEDRDARLGWDDVGDFSSLADLIPAEANQPRVLGDSGLGASDFSSYIRYKY